MTVELQLAGVHCNLQCHYCYQHPMRQVAGKPPPYDLEKIQATMKSLDHTPSSFTLFGGDPLILPLAKLEEVWAMGLREYGRNGIQTNGAKITEAHLAAFRKYKVTVGISMDGPGDLNAIRSAGSQMATTRATETTHWALLKLLEHGCYERHGKVMPTLIITVSRSNGREEVRDQFLAWLKRLHALGLKRVRFHPLEASGEVAAKWQLTIEEMLGFYNDLQNLEPDLPGMEFEIFKQQRAMLLGDDGDTTCIWKACDPWATRSVDGIDPVGTLVNCGRSNLDGVEWLKTEPVSYIRQLLLYETPWAAGGCQGCRFFLMCKGYCPGTAIDEDWRNRSGLCELIRHMLAQEEDRLIDSGKVPLSQAGDRVAIETKLLEHYAVGVNAKLSAMVKAVREDKKEPEEGSRETHTNTVTTTRGQCQGDHANVPHGDHTDHGDSTVGDEWDGEEGGIVL